MPTGLGSADRTRWESLKTRSCRTLGTKKRTPSGRRRFQAAAGRRQIVCGDRVFLTTVTSTGKTEEPRKGLYFGGDRFKASKAVHEWRVLCLDLTSGKVLWNRLVEKAAPGNPIHIKNSYSSETPVTDGQRVYAYFGNVGVFAFSLDEKPLWQKRLKPVRTRFEWGTASSPVLHGERLYIVNDNEEQSYLLALDTQSGDEIWRVDRKEGSNWATPFVWENELWRRRSLCHTAAVFLAQLFPYELNIATTA